MDAKPKELAMENQRLKGRVEVLERKDQAARASGRRRIRGIFSGILVILTALSLVAATAGVWTSRTVWNEEKFMARVAPVIQQPGVQEAMATELTDQVFVALDVQDRVSAALGELSANTRVPEQVTFLAGPLTEGMHDLVHGKVKEFIASDTFYGYWTAALQQMHPKMVALLEGDYSQLPNVSVSGGEVRLNLVPIVAQILKDLVREGLGSLDINLTIPEIPAAAPVDEAIAMLRSRLGVDLPEDFGQVTVMTENQLASMQAAANGMRLLAWGLALLTLILALAAIAVAPDRRLALGLLGVASALGMLLAFAALRNLRSAILDGIDSVQVKAAASDVFVQLGGSLRGVARWIFWISVLVAIIALILSRRPVLDLMARIGRSCGGSGSDMGASRIWAAHHSVAAYAWSIGVAAVVLFVAGISLVSLLVIGGLLAIVLMWITAAQNDVSKAPGFKA